MGFNSAFKGLNIPLVYESWGLCDELITHSEESYRVYAPNGVWSINNSEAA